MVNGAPGRFDSVSAVAVDPRFTHLVVGDTVGYIRVYDLDTLYERAEAGAQLSPDEARDGTVAPISSFQAEVATPITKLEVFFSAGEDFVIVGTGSLLVSIFTLEGVLVGRYEEGASCSLYDRATWAEGDTQAAERREAAERQAHAATRVLASVQSPSRQQLERMGRSSILGMEGIEHVQQPNSVMAMLGIDELPAKQAGGSGAAGGGRAHAFLKRSSLPFTRSPPPAAGLSPARLQGRGAGAAGSTTPSVEEPSIFSIPGTERSEIGDELADALGVESGSISTAVLNLRKLGVQRRGLPMFPDEDDTPDAPDDRRDPGDRTQTGRKHMCLSMLHTCLDTYYPARVPETMKEFKKKVLDGFRHDRTTEEKVS